jgi:hypothetical protein
MPYLPYVSPDRQTVLGHYAVAQKSGATVSVTAGSYVGRIRWSPTTVGNVYCVLLRVKVGWIVTANNTTATATPMDFDACVVRNFTVDFTGNLTAVNLTTGTNYRTNCMRASMSPSQMGSQGPAICTTVGMTGATLVADAAAFAETTFANQPSGNSTATQYVGVAGTMQTLYEWTGGGQHPVVLGTNEGVVVREVTAGPTAGTLAIYLQWEWAEVLAV